MRIRVGAGVGALLLVPALTVASTATASGASKAPPAAVSIGNPGTNVTQLPQFVAQQEGFFTKRGIALSSISFSGGPAQIAAIVSGSLDVAVSSPTSLAQADQAGNTLAYFCGVDPNPTTAFLALPSSSLKPGTWKSVLRQLAGKSVGVQVSGGSEQVQAESALTQAGVNPSQVTFIPIGIGPPAEAAFLKGTVDLYEASFPQAQELLASHQAKLLTTVGGTFPSPTVFKTFNYGYFAEKTWIVTHQKLAAQFCAAIGDAVTFMQKPKNLHAVERIISTQFSVTPSVAATGATTLVPSYSTALPKAGINAALEASIPPTSLRYSNVVLKP
jgi:NitT/TauT family transport system substrate-binding protein